LSDQEGARGSSRAAIPAAELFEVGVGGSFV
jgi:hypothetical protein